MNDLTDDSTISAVEACRLAGVSYRQADYWVREGLVSPTVPARGSGTARRFDPIDVLALVLVKTLLGRQVSHRTIREAQRFLGGPQGFLWVQGDVVGVGDEYDLAEAIDFVPTTIVVNLRTLRASLGLDALTAA